MLRYIFKRILYIIPTLFIVTILVFLFIHLIPGDPVSVLYGVVGSQIEIEVVKSQLNLDKPIVTQYYIWVKSIMKGDFGYSLRSGQELWPIIKERFKNTFILIIISLSISAITSIFLGVVAAYKRNTLYDIAVMSFAILGISIPVFLAGLLAIYFFAVYLNILPSTGYVDFTQDPIGALKYLILPTLSLAFALIGYTTRMTRSQMIDALNKDYIRTARSKGVVERVVLVKHALKNASIPIVTAIGLQLGFLMGGSVVIEKIYGWPGIGRFLVNSIFNRDYTAVQAVVLIIAFFFIFINLVVDITYAFLNPKIRYK